MKQDSVFLTGATGYVGGAILAELGARGRRVRALVRDPKGAEMVRKAGAVPALADLLDVDGLRREMEGVGVVFHAAGVNAFCLPDPSHMRRVNIEGSIAVVQAAAQAGVRRIVYTSSAATIGESQGTIGREDVPHRGTFLSEYERSKTEAEQAVFATATASGVEVVSVNPASVQGPGRLRGTGKLVLAFLNGKLRTVVDSRFSLVDVQDCTQGHLLAELQGKPGERYLLSGATLTISEAVELLGGLTGRTQRPRVVPGWMATSVSFGVGGGWKLLRKRAPICPEMVRTILHGHAYDGSKATRELGLNYTPIQATLRRAIDWYREHGYLKG